MGFFKKVKRRLRKIRRKITRSPILSAVVGAGLAVGAGALVSRLARRRAAAVTPAKKTFLGGVLSLAKGAASRIEEGYEGVADAALLRGEVARPFPLKTVLIIGAVTFGVGLTTFIAVKTL